MVEALATGNRLLQQGAMKALCGTVCIFDLDGTLVDSAPDLTAALNRILAREGLRPVPGPAVRNLIGDGARALLLKGYALADEPLPEGARREELVHAFIADYAARSAELSRVFPGVERALRALAADGAALAVCTNKTEELALPVLEKLGLSQWFAPIIASDTLPEKKPSPLPLQHILKVTGARRGVMIGDGAADVGAAAAVPMPCLLHADGYGTDDPTLSKVQRFHSFDDLPAAIHALLKEGRQGQEPA